MATAGLESFRILGSWDWVSITNSGEKNNIFDDEFWTTFVAIHIKWKPLVYVQFV